MFKRALDAVSFVGFFVAVGAFAIGSDLLAIFSISMAGTATLIDYARN
jgi:hypothetical protein